jgi:hypothetical protein
VTALWRDSSGKAVSARNNGPLILPASVQLARLDEVIAKAIAARREASENNLFASKAGKELVNAMFELTEVDGLYDLARDVGFFLPGGEQ